MSQTKFLVTGANGYIAMHVVDQLLKQGHYVRGTIRSLNDTEKVESLKKLGPIEIVEANLMDDESIRKAAHGIDVIMHIASPLVSDPNVDDEFYIKPAVQGTLSVLKAAVSENVKKVVLTSSTVTIHQLDLQDKTYTEQDWADVDAIPKHFFSGYQKSKIKAEQAAWAYYAQQKEAAKSGDKPCFHLASVLPSFTLGPVLSAANRSSVNYLLPMLDKSVQKMDEFSHHVCDVRDVAAAHLKAAQLDEADGHRFMVVSSPFTFPFSQISHILAQNGYQVAQVDAQPSPKTKFDDSNTRNILKLQPTELNKTVLDMVESLFAFGIIHK